MAKVTVEIEVDTQELWESVFGASPFSFGDHWVDVHYSLGTEWDKIGSVIITCLNADDKEVTKTVTIESLLEALPIANSKVSMNLLDFDDYDAVCADAILQVAVIGDVVFG